MRRLLWLKLRKVIKPLLLCALKQTYVATIIRTLLLSVLNQTVVAIMRIALCLCALKHIVVATVRRPLCSKSNCCCYNESSIVAMGS